MTNSILKEIIPELNSHISIEKQQIVQVSKYISGICVDSHSTWNGCS